MFIFSHRCTPQYPYPRFYQKTVFFLLLFGMEVLRKQPDERVVNAVEAFQFEGTVGTVGIELANRARIHAQGHGKLPERSETPTAANGFHLSYGGGNPPIMGILNLVFLRHDREN